MRDYRQLLGLSDDELAQVDPLVMNLLVAKGIPSLAHLDVAHYQRMRDRWAYEVAKCIPYAEKVFARDPGAWDNDINFLRLCRLHEYVDGTLGVRYIEEQAGAAAVLYTNPSDLFLNGVMDTLRGTCANMPLLAMVIARRLGWPVSLACARNHVFLRYDDGRVTHNLESTYAGKGRVKSDPDQFMIDELRLSRSAIRCGSDMRALTPRELLGLWIGHRARHLRNTNRLAEAESDYLLARWLYPSSQNLYVKGTKAAIERGAELFEPGEEGYPVSLAQIIMERFGPRPPFRRPRSYVTEPRAEMPGVVRRGPMARGIPVSPTQRSVDDVFIEMGRKEEGKR